MVQSFQELAQKKLGMRRKIATIYICAPLIIFLIVDEQLGFYSRCTYIRILIKNRLNHDR